MVAFKPDLFHLHPQGRGQGVRASKTGCAGGQERFDFHRRKAHPKRRWVRRLFLKLRCGNQRCEREIFTGQQGRLLHDRARRRRIRRQRLLIRRLLRPADVLISEEEEAEEKDPAQHQAREGHSGRQFPHRAPHGEPRSPAPANFVA